MDRIKQLLNNLTELTDEDVAQLQSDIISEFESVESDDPTPQTVETMTSLADMLDAVRSEVQRRETLSVEMAQKAEEAATRVHGKEATAEAAADTTPEENTMDETTPAADAGTPNETTPATEGTPEEEAQETPEEADKEKKAGEMDKTAYAAESSDTSFDSGESSELSTEATPEIELSQTTPNAPKEVQEENTEAPVTATAGNAENLNFEVPADRRPVVQAQEVPVAITAGADIPGITAGTALSNMTDVANAFAQRLHGLRRVDGGSGEQHIVASFSTQYPEDLRLGNDSTENFSKIKEATPSTTALTAGGGWQAPYAVRYDIFGIGDNFRPIRDSLPKFQADRGGIRYVEPPALVQSYGTNSPFTQVNKNLETTGVYDRAIGIWTASTDTTRTGNKAGLQVASVTERYVGCDAVTLQLTFGNMATRAYPELIARHNELALIQHAREAEQNLFNVMARASVVATELGSPLNSVSITTGGATGATGAVGVALGAAVDFLLQVGRSATWYRIRHRMEPDAKLHIIAPIWLKAAIQADFLLQMPGDNKYAVTFDEIDQYLASRNITATWTSDALSDWDTTEGYRATSAQNIFPNVATWMLFAEGTFLFLDGGTLDLGIVRDSTLLNTNDYKMFVETFEGVARVGVESLVFTSYLQVNGARAALRDTISGAVSGAYQIEF